jgi:hypothetical protein
MKKNEVPQDNDENYEGHKKIRYARNDDGQVIKVPSSGCSVEKDATSVAWDDINEKLKETYLAVESGVLSPLAYHMEKELLEPSLLAANLGLWGFTIKKHLKPKFFNKLSKKHLKLYTEYFELTEEEFKTIPGQENAKR